MMTPAMMTNERKIWEAACFSSAATARPPRK